MGLKEPGLKRGMAQWQLAEKVGAARQHIAAYENGVNDITNMTLGKALRICDALHVADPRKLLDSDSSTE